MITAWATSRSRGCWNVRTVRATRVRIIEVTPEHIVVKGEDFGAIDIHTQIYELPWPLPATLREPTGADPSPYEL